MPMTFDELCPNMILDITKLKDSDMAAFTKYLSENSKQLTVRIRDTTKELLSSEWVYGHDPSFVTDPAFKRDWLGGWRNAISRRLLYSDRSSSIRLVFPVSVFLHDCYDVSCSKVLLGCETKTVPPVWLRSFLNQVQDFSKNELAELNAILDSGTVTRQDVVFTLSTRIAELAAERGMRPDEIILYPGIRTRDAEFMRKELTPTKFTETGNSYAETKQFMGNHPMLRLVIALCALYQVSPDYLLIQDYSQYLVRPNGKKYPLRQKDIASRLLCVDTATQLKAIGYVFATSAAHVLDGQEVNFGEGLLVDNDTLNIMEFMSKASNDTVDAKNKKFIETVKPKLLAVFAVNPGYVSQSKLYSVATGHTRLVRLALTELEAEGRIEKKTTPRGTSWILKN